MPLQRCMFEGKPGWKWGEHGRCYTGADAKEKAMTQAAAARASGFKESVMELVERNYSASLKVDADAGVIHGVKVLGRTSKNNRIYSDVAVVEAARLYDGVDVNLDHGRGERKLLERFGTLSAVRIEKDGVYADLNYLKSHPSAAMIVESATRFASKIGLSHHAEGVVKNVSGKQVVESIKAVRSVDLVANPATTAGLFEQEGGMGEEMMSFMQAIATIVNEPDTSVEEKVAKIKAVLEAKQQMLDALSGEPAAEPEQDEEKPMAESVAKDNEVQELRDRLAESLKELKEAKATVEALTKRQAVVALFEAAGVKPDDLKIAAALAIEKDEDRKALIESWKPVKETAQPRSASRLSLYESTGDERYEEGKLVEQLTGRKAKA